MSEDESFTGSFVAAAGMLPSGYVFGVVLDGIVEIAQPGKLFIGHGRFVIDGLIMTDNETGEKWKFRATGWNVIRRATKSIKGRERYERRYKKSC